MSLRRKPAPANPSPAAEPPGPWLRLIAFGIVAIVLIVVVVITRSTAEASMLIPALLLMLSWLSTGKSNQDSTRYQESS